MHDLLVKEINNKLIIQAFEPNNHQIDFVITPSGWLLDPEHIDLFKVKTMTYPGFCNMDYLTDPD